MGQYVIRQQGVPGYVHTMRFGWFCEDIWHAWKYSKAEVDEFLDEYRERGWYAEEAPMTEDEAIENLHTDIDSITGKAYCDAGETDSASKRMVAVLVYHAALRAAALGYDFDDFLTVARYEFDEAEKLNAQIQKDIDGSEER